MDNILLPLFLSFLAGMCTILGSFILFFIKDFKKSYLSFFLGISAGAMIYLSFIELIPQAIKTLGFLPSNVAFFLGILFIGVVDFIAPYHFMAYCSKNGIKYNKLMLTGFMVAVGISIHNFPEGMVVFMSSLGDIRYGAMIAFSTALHNIPEGIAIATPVYFATKSKLKAFSYTFLAGIAEPLGAIIAYIILQPYLSPVFLSYIFAFVAGIMVYISFDELLPSCFENSQGRAAIVGIVIGMLVIASSLNFM
ncbi:zinc transporter ZupT [Patescibacteria group bacterium]|nr:zinc transporter ZupT [Patescibacteria group bacterium]